MHRGAAKRYRHGTHRITPPAQTLPLAHAAAAASGVTRLADVTGLDTIGIPVFQAIRPGSLSLSVSQGKGVTRMAARVSALMEAVELACAETVQPDHLGPGDTADLAFAEAAGSRSIGQAWHSATDLLSRKPLRVPHGLVTMDFTREDRDIEATSNGLASGNDTAEAIVSALAEVLERDAHARWLALTTTERAATAISLASIDDRIGLRLLALVRHAGLHARLCDMSHPGGPATLGCAIYDGGSTPAVTLQPAFGTGAHPSASVALARAITEAAQSRATMIAGSRDDISPANYAEPGLTRLRLLLGTGAYAPATRDWRSVPDQQSDDVHDDLGWLLACCRTSGARQVACVEMPAPLDGLAVVKVIVPGFGDPHR